MRMILLRLISICAVCVLKPAKAKYSVVGYDCSDMNLIQNISTEIQPHDSFEVVNSTPGHVQILQEVHSSQVKQRTKRIKSKNILLKD